jgi:nicotinate-nucleotide adenylyltransferase
MIQQKKIGLLGGTFDPIHLAHLILAEQVRDDLELDEVYFVPAGNPPHKSDEIVTEGALRSEMVYRAIEGHESFDVFDYELQQEGLTYSIDTVDAFKRLVDKEAKLFFITGADQILKIETWKSYRELLTKVNFVVARRPGSDQEQLEEKVEMLRSEIGATIQLVEIPSMEISSTHIRQRVAERRTIRYMVPAEIDEFIKLNNLYI